MALRPSVRALVSCVLLLVPATLSATQPPTGLERRQLHIGRGLAQLSPMADPADAHARDQAAVLLSRFQTLSDALGDSILWGGYDPAKGYDPKKYTLTEFYAPVWVKIYLSTFMFSGEPTLSREGDLSILEVPATFRRSLQPGDYAYPFWHSADKWRAYVNSDAIVFVFRDERIVAAFRKVGGSRTTEVANIPWDGQWTWTAADGTNEPRVALFSYLFSPNNPKVAPLEVAYRALEEGFREQTCNSCHAPDNSSKMRPLVLLNYPNQALAARDHLVETFTLNVMPPEDEKLGTHEGIADPKVRRRLIDLAKAFERAADDALAFEHARGSLQAGAGTAAAH